VFCTGKVFYELHAERERLGLGGSVALVRVEQLMPFPFDLVCRELHRYPNAELVWCQEEPMNMGAYFHVQVLGVFVFAPAPVCVVVLLFDKQFVFVVSGGGDATRPLIASLIPTPSTTPPPSTPKTTPTQPTKQQPRLESCLRKEGRPTTGRITYAGRPPSASTATGFGQVHAAEQAKLVSEALDLDYKMVDG
jgi:hypothetical protein